jgi:hypothetical protein
MKALNFSNRFATVSFERRIVLHTVNFLSGIYRMKAVASYWEWEFYWSFLVKFGANTYMWSCNYEAVLLALSDTAQKRAIYMQDFQV